MTSVDLKFLTKYLSNFFIFNLKLVLPVYCTSIFFSIVTGYLVGVFFPSSCLYIKILYLFSQVISFKWFWQLCPSLWRLDPSNLSNNNGVSNSAAFIFVRITLKLLKRINISIELLLGSKKIKERKYKKCLMVLFVWEVSTHWFEISLMIIKGSQ